MTKMGMTTLHRKPNKSKPESGHKTHLYLLHQVIVDRLNQA
jgi:hypothetical protein